MDKYQSHKIVHAALIVMIEQSPADEVAPEGSDGTWRIHWQSLEGLSGYETVPHRTFDARGWKVGGYIIKYGDGYLSYSPHKAFVDGYEPASEPTALISVNVLAQAVKNLQHFSMAVPQSFLDATGLPERKAPEKLLRGQNRSIQYVDEASTIETGLDATNFRHASDNGMTFGIILELLHGGKRARRPDWPLDNFIYMVTGSTFTVNRAPLNRIFGEGTVVNYKAHIDYYRARHEDQTHHCSVWTPSQDDMLANDWQIRA